MPGQKVLLVEDEAITALDLRTSLAKLGYLVPAVVQRGEEVLTTASDLRPDLILMDILLAGKVSGIDAAGQVRESLGIPVIFLTAHSDAETIARAARTEPFGYLSKPCSLTDLTSTIEVALVKSAADARLRESEEALRRSEAEVRELNARLEQRVAERTAELEAFSYTVAHDLKTPLRGIDGFAAMLLEDEGERLTEAGRRALGRIRAASQRGGQLIEGLLDLSALTKAALHRERIDLTALAIRVSRRLQAEAPDRRVNWRIEPGLEADADLALAEKLLEQLLDNAWKFTAKREVASIELGATLGARRATFFVRDNGVGFEMAHAGELFGPFHRAHSEAEFPGLGLGLAIAAKIVQRHGGGIRAEGSPGAGATVFFTL